MLLQNEFIEVKNAGSKEQNMLTFNRIDSKKEVEILLFDK